MGLGMSFGAVVGRVRVRRRHGRLRVQRRQHARAHGTRLFRLLQLHLHDQWRRVGPVTAASVLARRPAASRVRPVRLVHLVRAAAPAHQQVRVVLQDQVEQRLVGTQRLEHLERDLRIWNTRWTTLRRFRARPYAARKDRVDWESVRRRQWRTNRWGGWNPLRNF